MLWQENRDGLEGRATALSVKETTFPSGQQSGTSYDKGVRKRQFVYGFFCMCICVRVCVYTGLLEKSGNSGMCLSGIGHPALGCRCGLREVRGSADWSVPSQPVSPECLRQEGHHLWSRPGLVSHTALSTWAHCTAFTNLSFLICTMGCLSQFMLL